MERFYLAGGAKIKLMAVVIEDVKEVKCKKKGQAETETDDWLTAKKRFE